MLFSLCLQLYKEQHAVRAHWRRQRRLQQDYLPPPPFRDPLADPFPLHPGAHYPPGYIGGDYDMGPNFGGTVSKIFLCITLFWLAIQSASFFMVAVTVVFKFQNFQFSWNFKF